MPKPLSHRVAGGPSLEWVQELEALVAVCPEGFPGCPIPCPVCPLERSWVFPAAQHPWGTGRCCDTRWVSHWRLRFGGHRWGTPTPTLSSGVWGTWGPEGAGLGVQEGAGSEPTARLCPGSGGHRAALASLHSARIRPRPPARCPDREPIPSGSPHCSHLTFTATVTTLSRLRPIFHSLLPLIQSLCPFKLFFFPSYSFPGRLDPFLLPSPSPEQLLC